MKYLISLYLIAISLSLFSQDYSVSGFITDKKTGETLIGATLLQESTNKATISDRNGYFVLSGLSAGNIVLSVSFVGYESVTIELQLSNKKTVLNDIELVQKQFEIDEVSIVEIKPDGIGDTEVEISHIKLNPKLIQSIPTAGSDVFRAIQFLPGISGGDLYSPIYSARGGDPSENLIMLDGVTMYNPYHYIISSGIFNIKSVKNIELMVGGFGAEYGGRNSSILNITTKDGDRSGIHGEVEPTTTHTKAFLEFPVGKKATMMVAGRIYYDLPSRFLMNAKSWFYDLNISYTNRINKNNKLKLKVFSSRDKLNLDVGYFYSFISGTYEEFDFWDNFSAGFNNVWNNQVGTAILNSIISPKLFLRSQIYASLHNSSNYSDLYFEYSPEDVNETFLLEYSTDFDSKINDITGKSTLSYKISGWNTLNTGIEATNYYFKNYAAINDFDKGTEERDPILYSGFIEDKINLGRLLVRLGLRASDYSLYSRWMYEPRINVSFKITDDLKFKAAWGDYYQYIISMNTQEYEVNQMLEYYYPLRNRAPSHSIHYIAGFEKELKNNSSIKLDFYYKDMPRVYSFDLNQSELELATFSDKLIEGTGYSYGLELLTKLNWKKLSGWLSYAYNQSFRKYPDILGDKYFIFDYNRPHSFKAIINWQVSERFFYNSSIQYMSGLPKTLESTVQEYYTYDPVTGNIGTYPHTISSSKNNARTTSFLDINLGIKKEIRHGFSKDLANFLNADKSYLTITIANLLFLRRNVVWYLYNPDGEKYIPIGLNYFPGISAGYTIKF